jgi:hypothetical protein
MISFLTNKLLDLFASNPVCGVCTWFTGWIISIFPDLVVDPACTREIILWLTQIVSLLIGSIAGILTIVSLIRKNRKHDKS